MAEPGNSGSAFQLAADVWSRRHWLALGVLTAVLGATLAMAIAVPPIYRATATVLVEREQVPEAMVRPSVSGELETRLLTISQQILSRARLAALIDRFHLYPTLRDHGPSEAAVEQMRKDILLEPKVAEQSGGRSSTVGFNLSYRAPDPHTAADVTNALAALYVEQNSKIREQQAAGTAQFLKAQMADVKKRLEEQERHVGQPPPPVEIELAGLERLNARLRLNSERQLRALDRKDRVAREVASPASPSGTAPVGETPAAHLARLQRELAELRTRYTDKYPDIIRTKAEIAALESRVAAAPRSESGAAAGAPAAKRPPSEADAELKALESEEAQLRQAITVYERRMEDAPRRQQDYQREARDYAVTKEFYQSLVKRHDDAVMAESMEQGQKAERFHILDPAVPPRLPVAPNRLRLGMMAVAISIGAAVGAVMLSERLDTSFHTMDDLRAFTRVPVVTGVPPLVTDRDAARRRRRTALGVLLFLVGLVMVAGLVYAWAHDNMLLARMLSGGQ